MSTSGSNTNNAPEMPAGQSPIVQPLAQQLSGTVFERSQRENPAVIEGYVYLKRKQDWVKRYASVANSVNYYDVLIII